MERLSQFIFAVGLCCTVAGPKVEGLLRIRNFNLGVKLKRQAISSDFLSLI